MTDKEFVELQKEIRSTMEKLNKLQDKHIRETGRRFVLGQPIRNPKVPDSFFEAR